MQRYTLLFLLTLFLFSCKEKEVKPTFVDETKFRRQEVLAAFHEMEKMTYESAQTSPKSFVVDGKLVRNERHLLTLRSLFYSFSTENAYNLFHNQPKDIQNWFDSFNNAPATQIGDALENFVRSKLYVKRPTPLKLIDIQSCPTDSLRDKAFTKCGLSRAEAYHSHPGYLRFVLYMDQNVRAEYQEDALYRYFRKTLLNTRARMLEEKDLLEISLQGDSLFIEGEYVGDFSKLRIYQDDLFEKIKEAKITYDDDSLTFFPKQKLAISGDDSATLGDFLTLSTIANDAGYEEFVYNNFFGLHTQSETVIKRPPVYRKGARISFKDRYEATNLIAEKSKNGLILYATDTTDGDSLNIAIVSAKTNTPINGFRKLLYKAQYREDSSYNRHYYEVVIDTLGSLLSCHSGWGNQPTNWTSLKLHFRKSMLLGFGDIHLTDSSGHDILPILSTGFTSFIPQKAAKDQTVTTPKPSVKRSRAAIMRVVRGNMPQLQKAFEKSPNIQPGEQHRIYIKWGINSTGKVTYCRAIKSSFNDPKLEQKMVKIVRTWAYAPLEDSDDFSEFVYPFVFVKKVDAASLSEILQIIVDHDSFAEYLHLELPERQQLYLSRVNLQGIVPTITVADKGVELVDSDSKEENLLILKSVSFKSTSSGLASVSYPIEGVRAIAKIEKYDGKWQVHEMMIREQ